MKKSIAFITALSLLLGTAAVSVSADGTENTETYVPLNRDGKVFSDNQSTAYAACNDKYYDSWQGSAGSYLAWDLSGAGSFTQIELVWYSGAWGNYDYTVLPESPYASLSAYTIEVNRAPGGDYPETGWEKAAAVTGCTTHSAEHVIDFAGCNWVRLTVDETQNGQAAGLNVDIHAPQPVFEDSVIDSWMFYGDSITACGMTTFGTGNGNFADLLHAIEPSVYPAQQNGGIGGIRSIEGKANIDKWLSQFAGQYVSIAYGTNDCWGDQTGAQGYYENTVYMIGKAQAAGKTVVLPKIPFSLEPGVANNVEKYNAMIDKIYAENKAVIPGPDFYAFFKEHPEYLSGDGVHPSEEGYGAMRQLWAEEMYEKIYRLRGKISSIVVMKGDCNNDYAVNLADVVLLQKYLLREIEDFRHPEAADYNGDKKLNAIDLSLLKHYLLRTEDEQINDWLKDWSGKYHVMIDYSAWTEKLTAVSAECETGCKATNNSINKLVNIEVPKLDPREAGKGASVTVKVSMTAENGAKLDADLTFHQYVYDTAGALAALYHATDYTIAADGSISAGESR